MLNSIKLYFSNVYWLEENGIQLKGWELYSMGHILWLVAMAVLGIVVTKAYIRGDESHKRKMKKSLALSIIGLEILTDTIVIIYGTDMINYLPLHMCSFAMGAMALDAFFPRQKISGQLMCYLFMPGAMCAELFCSWAMYPINNFMSINSFIFHWFIIVYMAMIYYSGETKPTYKGLWRTMGVVVLLAIPVYIFDRITGMNYMFLNVPSEGSPLVFLWNIFGTKFGLLGYLISYALTALSVVHILYVIYNWRKVRFPLGKQDEEECKRELNKV